jgi:hypothetical protein
MTVASGGAGDITLGTAVDGYQTFADAGVSDTDVVRYTIEDGDNWEIGTGVYTASGTTLVRTVTESSNSDAALTCSADAEIFVTMAAEDFTGNAAPRWTTTPTSSLEFTPGVASTITGVAIDEGGFPIQYSWDGYKDSTVYSPTNLPAQLTTAPTFNSATKTWTLTPSSSSANAGSFVFRSRASDGVNTITSSTSTILSFMYTTGLLGWYDADNYTSGASTWSDKSGNSGPAMTVNTSNITYAASSVGSKPTIEITGANAIGTDTTIGSGLTMVVIATNEHDAAGDIRWFGAGLTNLSTRFRLVSSKDSVSGNWYHSSTSSYGSNKKLYIDKVDRTSYHKGEVHAATSPNNLHSIVISDINLATGWQTGAGSSEWPRTKIRAVLFYDHILTAANIAMVHTYFKGGYSSDTDMAP